MKTLVFWVCLALVALVLIYIRLAPSHAQDWHIHLAFTANETLPNGIRRIVSLNGATLADFHRIATSNTATQVLAGSVDDAHITYISRSKVFGFPDYTTVSKEGEILKIYGRLRFGNRDYGVNAARVDRWVHALTANQT